MRYILLFLLTLTASTSVLAHEWYDYDCCEDQDCRPAKFGVDILATDNGWFIPETKETIPFDDSRIRKSHDSYFHICIVPEEWETEPFLRCIYKPDLM